MSVKEFRGLGYLQEVNRQFLHPLGLALEVVVEEDGTERFGEVWDSRGDPDGMIYGGYMLDADAVARGRQIEADLAARKQVRQERLGFEVQPLPDP